MELTSQSSGTGGAWSFSDNVSTATVPFDPGDIIFNSTVPLNSTTIYGNASTTGTTMSHYYGSHELKQFYLWYRDIHGYLASIVCVLGIIANMLNIIVLTRKNMVSSTNCILTGLAISDGLTMVAYLPFALRFYTLYGTTPSPERNSLGAIRFMLFFACFSVVVHSVSIWLTVTLAVFRYIFIKYPRRGVALCSITRAKIAVLFVYLVTLIVCIPNFITITVKGEKVKNSTDYIWAVQFKNKTKPEIFLYYFNFWIQAVLVKLLPCIGLTVLSFLLVKTMREAERRRRQLRQKTPKSEDSGRNRKTNRTTRMLLTVVALFLLTEFPQGILNLLSGTLEQFASDVYWPLGDFMDILALINNGINFILYCTMSKQFRDTFLSIFFRKARVINNNGFSLVATSKTEI